MKYPYEDIDIPKDLRKQVNDSILEAVRSKTTSLTGKEIYQAYTGLGGLHGLSRNDFDCYHDYAEAKREVELGQFFSPHETCRKIIDIIKPKDTDLIADLTCGSGNFFNHMPNESNIYGCELDTGASDVAKFLYPKANITCGDIKDYFPDVLFDIIVGNPPFNLRWHINGINHLSQGYFLEKAAELLRPGGLLAVIVPESFLSDEFMEKSILGSVNEKFNFIFQYRIDKNTFSSLGVTNFDTKLMVLQKASEHIPHNGFKPGEFVNDDEGLYPKFIKPLQEFKKTIQHKLLSEYLISYRAGNNFCLSRPNSDHKEGFGFVIKKYLFEIKTHPKLKEKYQSALNLVEQYKNQEKPKDMKYSDWERKRLTKRKILARLRRIVLSQDKVPGKDMIRIVKTNYGIKYKAYSPKARLRLSRYQKSKYIPFYDFCLSSDLNIPAGFQTNGNLKKVVNQKRENYLNQSQKFAAMANCPQVENFLDSFSFIDKKAGEVKLREIQKADMNLILQKRFGIIAWEMGGGKTAAGFCFSSYHQENSHIRNSIVVSSAAAIKITWKDFLTLNNRDFIIVQSVRDLEKIKPGQFVLITCNKINEIAKQVKKWLKRQNYKVSFLFDESDEITNFYSKRTRSVLMAFKKCKVKLLTTGTTTRNNINELYAQLELLYNNSHNFLCHCKTIYRESRERGYAPEIRSDDNDYYLKPFPAWRGNRLFSYCFNPSKTTVFGISKQNQDVYNQDHLVELIDKTIITRSLKDISGEQKYTTESIQVEQDVFEEDIYRTIIEETYQMIATYFESTGDSRKDSFLVAVRQMRLLIESCSTPQKFGYPENMKPAKMKKILEMVTGDLNNKQVAIGCMTLLSVDLYTKAILEACPFRQIFVITGATSFGRRKKIIADFQGSPNGILIASQDSLKNSLNIPSCKHVIIESLQWNLPRLKQFFFRFIRFNSVNLTTVYFVTYKNSIENNILALLMAKESLNDFVKTREFRDKEDFMQDYDIDLQILDAIMHKQVDEEGRAYVSWGKQKIA